MKPKNKKNQNAPEPTTKSTKPNPEFTVNVKNGPTLRFAEVAPLNQFIRTDKRKYTVLNKEGQPIFTKSYNG